MYIGITGHMGTGKGELCKMLQKRGYKYISLSDIVRMEADKRNLPHTRENLQNIGNDLREKDGSFVLGMRVREEIKKDPKKNWVIDGIRNPEEISELKKLRDFYVAGVVANPQTIIKRIQKRQRVNEVMSEEEVMKAIEREKGEGEKKSGQQVGKCVEQCDFLIINEGTLEKMDQKLEHFLGLLNKTDRPTFDEIFMELAYTWAKRSTCLRRQVGAVIAKDKQQLTAGYNGAPRGVPHCAELGGCLRAQLGVPSGQRHEICRGTHAEQNAITQASKFGINIENSTLYCTASPCVICLKMLINAGITRVVFDAEYNDPLAKEILGQQNILELVRYEGRKFNS